MLHITWLGHSGFAAETCGHLLVFDAYQHLDLIPIAPNKPTLYFASHNHGDHFNRDIFTHPADLFVLGADVRAKHTDMPLVHLDEGEKLERLGAHVETFGSTDAGVSFRVTTDGYYLFHAGDLNCWYWEEESTPQELQDDYTAWRTQLERLNDGTPIHVAFFPVDPRLGPHLAKGGVEYAAAVHPEWFIPMHFSAGDADVAAALEEIAAQGTRPLFPLQPGWSWTYIEKGA